MIITYMTIHQIRELKTTVGDKTETEILELFKHPAILHLWNSHVHDLMITCLESMAENGNWNDCYHGANHLGQALADSKFKQRIDLVKAWALFQLGLYKKSYAVLDQMDSCMDPTLADPDIAGFG